MKKNLRLTDLLILNWACMYYELGSCYSGLSEYRKAEICFLKILDYLEYKFPEKKMYHSWLN